MRKTISVLLVLLMGLFFFACAPKNTQSTILNGEQEQIQLSVDEEPHVCISEGGMIHLPAFDPDDLYYEKAKIYYIGELLAYYHDNGGAYASVFNHNSEKEIVEVCRHVVKEMLYDEYKGVYIRPGLRDELDAFVTMDLSVCVRVVCDAQSNKVCDQS